MRAFSHSFSQLPHRVVRAPPRLPTFAAENKVMSNMNEMDYDSAKIGIFR